MPERDEAAELLSLAELASSRGDHAAAERALRQALKLQEASLGLIHPEVANTLNNLGVVCDILGRPHEAEFLYRRALEIARKTVPADHPYIATSIENLEGLYRARGEPEKLAQVIRDRPQRSGLPGFESVDEDEAEVGTADAVVETAPAAPSAPTRSVWLDQRVLFGVIAGVGLLVVLGLLLGGGTGSDMPTPERAVARAPQHSPPVEIEAVTAEPANGLVSIGTIDTTEADAERAAVEEPAAQILVADVTPPPAEPATTPAAPQTTSARTSAVRVADARICRELTTRGSDGAPLADWQCGLIDATAAPGPLFFYTRIRSLSPTTVEHRWLQNDRLAQEVALPIQANDGPGYRTYSTRTLSPQETGSWRVELWSEEEELIHVEEFVVR